MKYILTLVFAALSFTLVQAQTKITAQEAQEKLSKRNRIQVVDVRTAEEYEQKHLKKAKNIDWYQSEDFEKKAKKLKKKRPVYVYCKSGGRSGQAAKKLTEMGYDVYDIQGGITHWEKEELPLVAPKSKKK